MRVTALYAWMKLCAVSARRVIFWIGRMEAFVCRSVDKTKGFMQILREEDANNA